MTTEHSRTAEQPLQRILRPLIRMLLRSGVSFGEFAEVAKRLYVELSMHEMQIPGRRASVSRAAVLTGLSRKEVQRTLQEPSPPPGRYNRAARVIAGWSSDPDFQDGRGEPAVLPSTGEGVSFAALVQRYSGDVPPRAILDELVRVGAAAVDLQGRVTLLDRRYASRRRLNEMAAVSGDVGRLIETIERNLERPAEQRLFQRTVARSGLSADALETLRPLVVERCGNLLDELDRLYGACDRDSDNDSGAFGQHRAGVGIYYFEVAPDAASETWQADQSPVIAGGQRPERKPSGSSGSGPRPTGSP